MVVKSLHDCLTLSLSFSLSLSGGGDGGELTNNIAAILSREVLDT